ncbi:MAG TPA: hypothetical protein VMM84_13825 [Pyrinomonadaceae bacterium]|nr:hypothetical protein [Pyrinomonadaceae bacterium]
MPSEVVTQYADASGVRVVTAPDGIIYKEFYGTGWQRGLLANEYEHSKPNTNSGPEKHPTRETLYHSTQPLILPNLLGWGVQRQPAYCAEPF